MHAPQPVKAAAHLDVRAVAAGWEHSLLLGGDGSVFQFGRSASSYISLPTQVPGLCSHPLSLHRWPIGVGVALGNSRSG